MATEASAALRLTWKAFLSQEEPEVPALGIQNYDDDHDGHDGHDDHDDQWANQEGARLKPQRGMYFSLNSSEYGLCGELLA